ncbi:DUF2635 domain-containing protein [Acetobacter orientalis]|uniref:DUF2635 domain-containing protein n=1 Tax=Acetobacter orientalis TaxID=146474 RepID=UPI0020A1451E|nr:DUF2635 domain-containing protein [Acetobacter orientalis]MCP1215586.1 DUF2635 domain-containing protein [Acetobacter orientalis]MCP1217561.1 DUF2635 domain-containing protein [Acetobacter orientalis]
MKIYPVAGRIARDPSTLEPVPAAGKAVSDYDPFWLRRLSDGDVTKTPPAAPAIASASSDNAAAPSQVAQPAASGGAA